jgi:hypothetical protein
MTRPLAYGKELAARRRNGERIGLLVVSVHDWEAGKWFEGRSEVARLVLPEDVPVGEADWSLCHGLDVVICGGASDVDFYAAASAAFHAAPASLWGYFSDGVWLMEPSVRRWYASEGPYDPRKFGAVLRMYRTTMMMMRRGFYGRALFDEARRAVLRQMGGVAA